MAEDNGYFVKNKFYFFDIKDGKLFVDASKNIELDSNYCVPESGVKQSLESLYPSDTEEHYIETEVCLKDPGLWSGEQSIKEKYNQNYSVPNTKIYEDTSTYGNFCLRIGDTGEMRYFTPVSDKYLINTDTPDLALDSIIIPTKLAVTDMNNDGQDTQLVTSYNLFYWQENFVKDADKHWKQINLAKNTGYQLIKYRLPIDFAVAIKKKREYSGSDGEMKNQHLTEYILPQDGVSYDDSNINHFWWYVPVTTINLATLGHRTSSWSKTDWVLKQGDDIKFYHMKLIDLGSTKRYAKKFGFKANTICEVTDNSTELNKYSTSYELTGNNFWFRQFQLDNQASNGNYKAPAYLDFKLDYEEVKFLEFTNITYKGKGPISLKVRNNNKFKVYYYICSGERRLTADEIKKPTNWSLRTDSNPNGIFKAGGELDPNSSSDTITFNNVASRPYVVAYFIVKSGSWCRLFIHILGRPDEKNVEDFTKYLYFDGSAE